MTFFYQRLDENQANSFYNNNQFDPSQFPFPMFYPFPYYAMPNMGFNQNQNFEGYRNNRQFFDNYFQTHQKLRLFFCYQCQDTTLNGNI